MRSTQKAIEKLEDLERARLDLIEATVHFTRPTIRPVFVPLNETWVSEAEFIEEFWQEATVERSENVELKPGVMLGNQGKHITEQDQEVLHIRRWVEPCLFWRQQHEPFGGDIASATPKYEKCLFDFFKLGSVSNDDFARSVERFTKVWGVLGVWPSVKVEAAQGRVVLWEPLSLWKEASSRVEGTLLVFASLSAEPPKPAPIIEWNKIIELKDRQEWYSGWKLRNPSLAKPSLSQDIVAQRQLLVQTVQDWLGQIHQVPKFSWPDDFPFMTLEVNGASGEWDSARLDGIYPHWVEMLWRDEGRKELCYIAPPFNMTSFADYKQYHFRPSRLFSVITLQLVATLTGRKGVRPCDFCGKPHVFRKKNPSDFAIVCPDKACQARNNARRKRKSDQNKKAAQIQE